MDRTRRKFLGAAAALPLLGALGTCGLEPPPHPRHVTPSGLPLRRVRVAEERVIRTIAGLRPFRRNGFRVEAQRFGDRLVIHNYGHGGGGITLAPGTARLAADLAEQTPHRHCAVIGAGVAGLTTAREMQRRGWQVSIHARDLPPRTTSNVAGGQWSPTSVFDEPHLTPAFEAQYETAARLSYRYYQDLAGDRYGVSWISNYQMHDAPPEYDIVRDRLADLYPLLNTLGPGEHPFPVPYARHFSTMLVEPAIYLRQQLEDFRMAGGTVNVVDFASREQLLARPEPVLFNCTGLGAKTLFGDPDLIPVKGQLSFLLPQPEVNYMVIGNGGLYMFPRRDGILLGGTFERGEWSTAPDPRETARIIAGHQAFFAAMADPWG